MTVLFRSASIGTTLSTSLPAGHAERDVLLAQVTTETNGTTPTAATSWTLIDGVTSSLVGGRPLSCHWYYIVRGASAPATNWSTGASTPQVGYLCYSGVDNANPVETSAKQSDTVAGSTTVTFPSITTSTDNCMIVGMAGVNQWASGTSANWVNERADGGATIAAHFYDDGFKTPAGSVASQTETIGAGWHAITLALKPDASPPPTVVASANAGVTTSRSPSLTFSGYIPVADDVVIMWPSSSSSSVTIAIPSEWVNPLGGTTDVESDAHELTCIYHLVTAAEVSAVTTTYTATNLYAVAQSGNVVGAVVRYVDPANVADSAASTFDSANTVTPHVLAGLTGANLSDGSLVLSAVAKDATGTYTTPAGWTQLQTSNTNQGKWLGSPGALTTAGVNVAATNITPSAGDEYASITVALTPAASGASGTIAATEVGDTATAAGTPTGTGTVAPTEGADAAAVSGTSVVTGAVAGTEGADVAAAAGTSGSGSVSGTIAAIEGADTAAAAGTPVVTGTSSVTEAADTAAVAGSPIAAATVAATEAANTATAAGTSSVSGTIAITEAANTAAAAGTSTVPGTIAATEGADLAAGGDSGATSGSIAVTEAANTAAAAGSPVAAGTVARTEAADTASSAGTPVAAGTVTANETADVGAIVAVPLVNGLVAVVEVGDTATIVTIITVTGAAAAVEVGDVGLALEVVTPYQPNPTRLHRVAPETRRLQVADEHRTLPVPSEARTMEVTR